MKKHSLFGRYFLALALLLVTAFAQASNAPPQHLAWVSAAFSRLAVSVPDRAPERATLKLEQTRRFVAAIAEASSSAPLPPRQYASLLLAIGGSESNFDTDVVDGRCPKHRCDPKKVKGEVVFQAKGAFQNHAVRFNRDLWQSANGNPEAQVEMADRALRRSLARCAPFAPFPAHVFRAYAGGSCSFELKDEQRRVALYLRMMATPTPSAGGAS
jgi:hypothetical protein